MIWATANYFSNHILPQLLPIIFPVRLRTVTIKCETILGNVFKIIFTKPYVANLKGCRPTKNKSTRMRKKTIETTSRKD